MTLRKEKPPRGFYRELASALPLGTAIIHLADTQDPGSWKLLAANNIATRIAGSSVSDFLELPFAHATSKSLPAKLAKLCTRGILRGRQVMLGRVRKRNPSGSQEVYMVRAIPLPGNCIGFLFEDMSLLSASTVARLEIESLLDHMCGAAGAILWRADPATLQFSLVKPGAKKVLGYGIERWRNEINFWKNHTHPDDWEAVQEHCATAAAKGHKREFDCRMYSAAGNVRWFRVYVQRTDLPAGRTALNGVMVDITDQLAERAARKLSAQLMQTQEQERKRISRDLHDSVGQYLTGLKLNLAGLRSRADGQGELQEKLQECLDLTEMCIEEVRSVSHNLYPPEVEMMGLIPALRSYGRHFAERAAIELKMEVPETNDRLESDQEIALFRIAQESLTNIQRHSMASSARLRLEVGAKTIALEIGDTGVGMHPYTLEGMERGTEGNGIGLLKMRERVHDLGGKLEIESNGNGTVVRAQIPRHNAAAEISHVNADLTSMIASIGIAVVLVGSDLTIRRITPQAQKVLGLTPGDVARPLANINPAIEIPDFQQMVKEVTTRARILEKKVTDRRGSHFLLRMLPYELEHGKIDGAVITLVEIPTRASAARVETND